MPIPEPRQLAWQELEYYAFVHFNMNTFTGREWGDGSESPALFAPSALDCRQWARVAKSAGMKGIILTAKHHDGFCLWPSKFSEHTVAHSPWREGHGDVVRELSEACREAGLRMGVYLSPWDRNCAVYGDSPKYNDYYAAQLEELLTRYGEIFEVWWDGACGEGPNGKRQVYDFERFTQIVRRLQPSAVIFSDIGPDIRWVGNESGFAGDTCWSMLDTEGFARGIGAPPTTSLNEGDISGPRWVPAECDVSIRPGWYYHAEQDGELKSVDHLFDLYERSVGHNGSLLLNLPVDRRGLVHENDAARLVELRQRIEATYDIDLAHGARALASETRGSGARFAAEKLVDGDPKTFWAANDGATSAILTLELAQPVLVERVVLREPIALGQRVARFFVEGRVEGRWRRIGEGTTIGNKRILRTEALVMDAVRLTIEESRAAPALSAFELAALPPQTVGRRY
ncbi:MAG: alpha-L-fucosidase [Planctomycetota bacterium]